MSIIVDILAEQVQDSVDNADTDRETWDRALDQVFGRKERHAVLLENIIVGFTCGECEHEETSGLDALVITGAPMCPNCDREMDADTSADVLPA